MYKNVQNVYIKIDFSRKRSQRFFWNFWTWNLLIISWFWKNKIIFCPHRFFVILEKPSFNMIFWVITCSYQSQRPFPAITTILLPKESVTVKQRKLSIASIETNTWNVPTHAGTNPHFMWCWKMYQHNQNRKWTIHAFEASLLR